MVRSHPTFVLVIVLVYYRTISTVETEIMLTQLITITAYIGLGMFMNAGKTFNLFNSKTF